MNTIFKNEAKIKAYARIQKGLNELKPNSSDIEITNFINQIPPNFLNQKEELMIICQLFAYYSRNNISESKKNAIKLFERILKPIKRHLYGESSFFWDIFGGQLYFKYRMYEEGLITIQYIIQKTRNPNSQYVSEFFLPEIMEHEPEIFEKEIKAKLQIPYSNDYINEFRSLRNKHFKWLRESNDLQDPIYREIEKDKLRLSIKTDDIDTFQKIRSNLNLPLDSKIRESNLENFYLNPHEVSLIVFASNFNAIKIFKFLVMNSVEIDDGSIFRSICRRNYDMFHIIENDKKEKAANDYLFYSILSWNGDVTEYVLNNYDFDFLQRSDIDQSNDEKAIELFNCICTSVNFDFFESTYLPFLRKNPLFVKRNINSLLSISFQELSGFMTSEIINHPEIDINDSPFDDDPLIVDAIRSDNMKAIEMIFNNPDFDINSAGKGSHHPLLYVCVLHKEMRMLKMFCDHPKININLKSPRFGLSALQMSISKGNSYATEYLAKLENIDFDKSEINCVFYYCVSRNLLFSLKTALRAYLMKYKDETKKTVLDSFSETARKINGFKMEHIDVFKNVLDEIKIFVVEPPKNSPDDSFKFRNKNAIHKKNPKRKIVRPVVKKT